MVLARLPPHQSAGGAADSFSLRAKSRCKQRLRSDTRLRAQPHGGSLSAQKRPAAKYSGAQELMLFYLEAQPEQLAQEVQPGCSSAQIRSAEGVHWSA